MNRTRLFYAAMAYLQANGVLDAGYLTSDARLDIISHWRAAFRGGGCE